MQTERASRSATRTASNGTTEHVAFVGDGDRVYSWLYLPASAPRGAVVICSSLHGEFMRNYRREVLLARRLAELGFAVTRFHYRFTGNSEGDGAFLTFDSMLEDTIAAFTRVRSASDDVGARFFIGTRWGGLVAAAAASADPSARLALWAPLVSTAEFFKDAFRSSLIRDKKEGVAQPLGRAELEAKLLAGHRVDAMASTIEPAFYRSSADRSLGSELGDAPRQILLMPIGPTGTVRPDLAAQVASWQQSGSSVDIEPVQGEESWWLIDDRWHDESTRPMTKELISHTSRWMVERAAQEEGR